MHTEPAPEIGGTPPRAPRAYKGFADYVDAKAARAVPVSVLWEITARCNLKCTHCYYDFDRYRGELPLGDTLRVLDEMATAGVLFLTLTGGEVLCHPHLPEILRHARRRRFAVTLYTAGTLLSQGARALLAETRPLGIEISLYGTQATHNRVTGVPGSFRRTVKALRSLLRDGQNVTVKCVAMKENFADLEFLRDFCGELGIGLMIDPYVIPRDNGETDVLDKRLDPTQFAALFELLKQTRGAADRETDSPRPETTRPGAAPCNAGLASVTISADGEVFPCNSLRVPLGNLREQSFAEVWRGRRHRRFQEAFRSMDSECNACSMSDGCARCPGASLAETGNMASPTRYACDLAAGYREHAANGRMPPGPPETSSRRGKPSLLQRHPGEFAHGH